MIHVTASQIEAVVAERISEYLQECDALLDEIMSGVARAGPITHTGSGCGFCSRAITALTGAATDQFPFELGEVAQDRQHLPPAWGGRSRIRKTVCASSHSLFSKRLRNEAAACRR
jgi:hypothetical protein